MASRCTRPWPRSARPTESWKVRHTWNRSGHRLRTARLTVLARAVSRRTCGNSRRAGLGLFASVRPFSVAGRRRRPCAGVGGWMPLSIARGLSCAQPEGRANARKGQTSVWAPRELPKHLGTTYQHCNNQKKIKKKKPINKYKIKKKK